MIGAVEHVLFASARFRERRLIPALAVVQQALDTARRPYLAFSGGKDSIALTALVHRLRPDVPLLWSDDELEYPETIPYMTDLLAVAGDQLIVTAGWAEHAGWFRPWVDTPFWRDPLPGMLRIECDADDYMASQGCDLTFTGLRMSENRRRRDWLARVGPLYRVRTGTRRRCCPLWDWTEDDVWALIVGWHLPYNSAYDRMEAAGIPRRSQRVGPLPLAPRELLAACWPDLLARLEERYERRWND